MKKGIAIMMAVVCLSFLGSSSTALAEAIPNYCSQCGVRLVSRGYHVAEWTTSHQANTGYYVNGEPITTTCYVNYSIDVSEFICPDGHGTFWSEEKTTATHSYAKCRN